MTRINCVPPQELHDKHLVAEYHEITRVFGLIKRNIASGKDPMKIAAPSEYTLGTGHVKFFYTRLAWVERRLAELALEMNARKMKVRLDLLKGISDGLPVELFGEWEPDEKALAINRERLAERLQGMEEKPKRKLVSHRD
jgi:deoxyribonuclease (pyrimidine dimer)